MFEFVYRQLDPTFEMPNSKVEEEVPAILKALRYRPLQGASFPSNLYSDGLVPLEFSQWVCVKTVSRKS